MGSGPVVSGVVSGDSVRFNFDNADWRNLGRIGGDTIAGLVNLSLAPIGSAGVAAGSFRVVRQ